MRDTAIRNIYQDVVTLNRDADAFDANGNKVELDEELITAEIARMTQEALDVKAIVEAKEAKIKALDELTVTITRTNTDATTTDLTFDVDDGSRASMNEALTSAAFLGFTEHHWRLADNSVELVTLHELQEALAKGIQAKGAVILGA